MARRKNAAVPFEKMSKSAQKEVLKQSRIAPHTQVPHVAHKSIKDYHRQPKHKNRVDWHGF